MRTQIKLPSRPLVMTSLFRTFAFSEYPMRDREYFWGQFKCNTYQTNPFVIFTS